MPDLASLKARMEQKATATPQEQKPLQNIVSKTIQIHRDELIAVCNSNPNHPVSKVYAAAARKVSAADSIVVDVTDLEAIMENKKVDIITSLEEQEIDGLKFPVEVNKKKLVDFPEGETPKIPNAAIPARTPTPTRKPASEV